MCQKIDQSEAFCVQKRVIRSSSSSSSTSTKTQQWLPGGVWQTWTSAKNSWCSCCSQSDGAAHCRVLTTERCQIISLNDDIIILIIISIIVVTRVNNHHHFTACLWPSFTSFLPVIHVLTDVILMKYLCGEDLTATGVKLVAAFAPACHPGRRSSVDDKPLLRWRSVAVKHAGIGGQVHSNIHYE